jgi:hypothetical protein
LNKIISGGQTGADNAGLDFAIENDIPHGGFCPKGRKSENGAINTKYNLVETISPNYLDRTLKNVLASDITLIFTISENLTGGSLKTKEFCVKNNKPFYHITPQTKDSDLSKIRDEITKYHIINIAGSRASKEREIYNFTKGTLNYIIKTNN